MPKGSIADGSKVDPMSILGDGADRTRRTGNVGGMTNGAKRRRRRPSRTRGVSFAEFDSF